MRPHSKLIGWYYTRDDEHIGPLTVTRVADLLQEGMLSPSEMLIEIAETRDRVPGVRYDYLPAILVVERSQLITNNFTP